MSRHGTPHHYLAHGLHHCSKEQAAHVFRYGFCLDHSQCWLGVAVCRVLRIEWCRDSFLRVLYFSRVGGIFDRSRAQRVPIVGNKQADKYPLCLLDRLYFLVRISPATPLGRSSRDDGNGSERPVFAAQAAGSPFDRPDSATDTSALGVASIESSWLLRSALC